MYCQWVGGRGGGGGGLQKTDGRVEETSQETPQERGGTWLSPRQPAGNKSNTCCFEAWDAGMAGISLAT